MAAKPPTAKFLIRALAQRHSGETSRDRPPPAPCAHACLCSLLQGSRSLATRCTAGYYAGSVVLASAVPDTGTCQATVQETECGMACQW